MSEQRWTIYLCPDCKGGVHGEADVDWAGEAEPVCPYEYDTDCEMVSVVPESELSLSLAREQRLREAAQYWKDRYEWLGEQLDPSQRYMLARGVLSAEYTSASEALSSVPDGERS